MKIGYDPKTDAAEMLTGIFSTKFFFSKLDYEPRSKNKCDLSPIAFDSV